MGNRRFTRRRRRPAVLGTAAFASIILLALGGLTLVGLDTVSSQGNRLARVTQPEIAQAPEVTHEEESGEQASSGGNGDGGESADTGGSSPPGSSDSGAAGGEASGGSGEEQEAAGRDGGSEEPGPRESRKSEEEPEEEQKEEQKEENQQEKEDPAPPDPQIKTMWMSIPKLGIQGDTVYNSDSHAQMGVGAIKLPPTGFPWQGGANTYISAHRVGYPGTQSYYQFYALPAMQSGDVIYVGDANGTTYEYRVTKKFAVKPWENWVTEPKAGEDMLTLQTCIDSLDPSTWWDMSPKLMRSGPDSARMIVRAEKVDTYYPPGYQS